MELKDRLKELREEFRVSRKELAKYLGQSYQSIAKYEAGTRKPDYNTLLRIANYFNVSIEYLLGETDDRRIRKNADEIKQRMEDYFYRILQLPEEEINNMLEIIEAVLKYKEKKCGSCCTQSHIKEHGL